MALRPPPSPTLAAAHKAAGVTYHGQKTHEKKVFGYLQKALGRAADGGAARAHLHRRWSLLENHKLLWTYAESAATFRFPKNAWFPYYEAESYFLQGPYRCPAYRVRTLLAEVRTLAQEMPARFPARRPAGPGRAPRADGRVAEPVRRHRLRPLRRRLRGDVRRRADDDEFEDDGW